MPKVVTQQRRGRAWNPRLLDRKSDSLPLSHRATLVPLLDISSTRGENGQPVGCVVGVYGETELRIMICVLVVLYSVAGNDIGHRTAVDCKQQWSHDGSLRDADVKPDDW